MILYTVKNGIYYNLEDFKEDLSDFGQNGFLNMTGLMLQRLFSVALVSLRCVLMM